jgi:hypothetical protein
VFRFLQNIHQIILQFPDAGWQTATLERNRHLLSSVMFIWDMPLQAKRLDQTHVYSVAAVLTSTICHPGMIPVCGVLAVHKKYLSDGYQPPVRPAR